MAAIDMFGAVAVLRKWYIGYPYSGAVMSVIPPRSQGALEVADARAVVAPQPPHGRT